MEEEKKLQQSQVQNNGQGSSENQGARRRRKKKKKGGNGQNNGQNQNAQNVQNTQGGNNQVNQNQRHQNNQNGENGGNGGKNHKKQKSGGNAPQNNSAVNQNNPNNQNNQSKKQKNQNKPQQQAQNNANGQKDNRKDTYVYVLDGNLYINLTNKCSNACDFCVRNERSSYYGHYLWLKNECSVEKVVAQANALGDLSKFKEVVFCGFGEPTYKVAEMVALCDYFHSKGMKTRLNTNGQGNLINKRDIAPDLKDKLDLINVSLNFSCADKYQKVCRSQYGENGFTAMIEFAKACKKEGIAVRFSIVDCIGEEEVEACKKLAESVRVPLYIRSYITDSE